MDLSSFVLGRLRQAGGWPAERSAPPIDAEPQPSEIATSEDRSHTAKMRQNDAIAEDDTYTFTAQTRRDNKMNEAPSSEYESENRALAAPSVRLEV